MKKNFQLFMFFLFTLLAAFLAYMGNEILVRINDLDDKVVKFESEVETLRGALMVVKSFEGIIEKDKNGMVLNEKGKAMLAKKLKVAEGFYCTIPDEEDGVTVVELDSKNKVKIWNVESKMVSEFSRARKPDSFASYFIQGSNIYVNGVIDGARQNRKFTALKATSKNFITQFEAASLFFDVDQCPRQIQVAY